MRSTLVHSLSDDSIHKTVQQFQKVPAGSSWLIGKLLFMLAHVESVLVQVLMLLFL